MASRAKLDTKPAQVTYFVIVFCPTAILKSYFVVYDEF